MPKLRPETADRKAKRLTKLYLDNNMSQVAVAKKEGVTKQAIHNRIKKHFVQKTLAEYLDKKFPKSYIHKKFKDGLEAQKVVGYLNNKVDGTQKVSDEFVEVPDLHCRHKYLVTLLECRGLLKHNGSGNGISVVNVIYAYREKPVECQQH